MGGKRTKPRLIIQRHEIPSEIERHDMSDILCPDQLDGNSLHALPPLPPAKTYFAPAGRDTPAELCRKVAIIERLPLLKNALDAMPNMVMILNDNRQIVAANRKLLNILGSSVAALVEKRPGEAIKCIRAKEGPDGCGTGVTLHDIAVQSMRSSTAGNTTPRPCGNAAFWPKPHPRSSHSTFGLRLLRLRSRRKSSLWWQLRTSAMRNEWPSSNAHSFTMSSIRQAAFRAMRITLHPDSASDPKVCQRLSRLSGQLIEAIQSQRDLIHAESGELKIQPIPLKAGQVLDELRNQYLKHPVAENRSISIGQSWDGTIITDRQILNRVLGNMLKNALEATSPGGTVTLSCIDNGDSVAFTVNNPEVMPKEVQLQVFQRSFSTKGEAGRGIGTYSMKLFGERYLGGRVDFVSRSSEGTTFRLALLKKPLA